MKNKQITVQFFKNDENATSIKCLKIFTKEHFNKIKNKVLLIKEGGILYPSKFVENPNKNSIFVTKDGKVVNNKKDSFYIIETANKIMNETKDCTNVKIFSESTIKPLISSKEVIEERTIVAMDPATVVKCECKNENKEKPTEEVVIIAKKEEKNPIVEVKVPTEDEKLDNVLTSVLESIQKKAQKLEEVRPKEETEVEKLKLELMKAKLSLIHEWIKSNKEE